ncbi:T9SS type A sorting domain-containing protein [bacterium]|nr:T9SS type A sorting domain-containing protein [bacterium]
MKRMLISLAVAVLFATSTLAQIIRVPADQPTIQAAINAAAKGDTVLVADGTYYENINFKGKAITVASRYWADGDTTHINKTIINGSRHSHPDSGSVVYFISGEDTNSVLTGFTITGGRGTSTLWEDGSRSKDGGGIFVKEAGAKIEWNKIVNNQVTAVADTFAEYAGIFVMGGVGGHIVIRNNDISHNTSTTTGMNGVAFGAVNLSVKGTCVFERNQVSHNVCDASRTAAGGGLYIFGGLGYEGNYIVRDNIISSNMVLHASANNVGGGVVIQNASPILTNNIISGNVALGGGGIWVYHEPMYTGIPRPILINNTITNNTAAGRGGGILVSGPQPSVMVMNTILWGNVAGQIRVGAGSITVRYSDVQGGWDGEGNIDADPVFSDNSFRLADTSPCLGKGVTSHNSGTVTLQAPATDFFGNPRPNPTGSRPDLGAVEHSRAFPKQPHLVEVPSDHPTIQSAINAAAKGDTVLVADGTYYENISFKGKAITVASHYWADGDTNHINNTIINGSRHSHPDSGSVVYFISGEDTSSVLTGLTITGGRGTPILWEDGYRSKEGGGIFVKNAGAKIEWNRIVNNQVTAVADTFAESAGIFVMGGVGGHIVIRHNDISYNTATTTGANGAAFGAIALATKETCVFEKNRVSHNVCDASKIAAGGGLYIFGGLGYQGHYIIRDNIISSNMLLNAPGSNGGGVVIQNASPILINNIISGNVARGGGGIWVYHEPMYTGIPKPVLINNTITNNIATLRCGGIIVTGPQPSVMVMNTILWGNNAPTNPQIGVYGGSIAVRYSDVQGGWSGEGNINADPVFADNSFRLADTSPCIGKGVTSHNFGAVTLQAPATDFFGNPRPNPTGSRPDLGAVEHSRAFPKQPHLVEVPKDYPTIQAAINAAATGDTVLVAEGTYYENINFKGKAITAASHYWADGDTNHINNTIINGSKPSHPDSGSVVYFISGEDTNSVLTGFTITGGRGTLTLWPSFPGFIDKDGGGIYVRNSGAKIEKNKIAQNHVTAAGDTTVMAAGMFLVGEVGDHIVIRNNDISRNTATATGVNLTGLDGGAGNTVYLMTKATCVFEKNRVIQNVCNSNNWANGGGLAIDGATMGSQGPYIIRDNIISGNKVLNGPYINGGGGVLIGNASPILTNNIISGNVARIGGGFWILHNQSYTGITKPVLINNTITNNSATERGGGILFDGDPQVYAIVMNTILWGNSAARGSQIWVDAGSITVRYSDVEGGWSGEGNKNVNPRLVADSLSNDSECIGAGTHVYDFGNGIVCWCPGKDINGRSRPYPAGTKPDIGAWESMLWTTAVESQPSAEIPKAYALHQNHPNPFNPSTTIEFALPKASLVTLKIYDLLGKEVATLVAEKLPAGRHQRVWEAKGLASGVYLYRLEAGEFAQVRKLILLQ